MAALTREQILARKLHQEVVDLPDGSGTVTVRGITRNEALELQDLKTTAERDNHVIAAGMIEPKLTADEVRDWAENDDAGTLKVVSEAIAKLSRMTPDAQKEVTKSAARRRR